MNIFVLDEDFDKSAQYHVDKHVVKMPLESVQILSSVARLHGYDVGYRLTHKNHPCVKWAAASNANYNWLKEFAYALGREYTYRYGKVHKSIGVIPDLPDNISGSDELTPFALAMPVECKIDNDPVGSYRKYYMEAKRELADWTGREVPEWWS